MASHRAIGFLLWESYGVWSYRTPKSHGQNNLPCCERNGASAPRPQIFLDSTVSVPDFIIGMSITG